MKQVLLFFFSLFSLSVFSQDEKPVYGEDFNPHAVNPWVSVPLAAGGIYLGQNQGYKVREKDQTPAATILALNRNDVPGIDRWALDLDLEKRSNTLFVSDYMANIAHASPLALFVWKKYRCNWLDISLMYLEAQAMQGIIYGYAPFGPNTTDRLRPFTYFEEVDLDTRRDGNERNSTFSGHVSTTTTSIYFVAKMIDDYNPHFPTGQRILLYAGASVPAAYSGWLRIKSLKHFPTDTAIGMGVGAFSGIMVPEFHRWWKNKHPETSAMILPFYGAGAAGAGLTLTF